MSNQGALAGKVAVVTGASRGIGKGIAQELGAAYAFNLAYGVGKAAMDRMARTGDVIPAIELAEAYGFCDVDGRQPCPLPVRMGLQEPE